MLPDDKKLEKISNSARKRKSIEAVSNSALSDGVIKPCTLQEITKDLRKVEREIKKIEATGLFCREDKQEHYHLLKKWRSLIKKQRAL